LRVRIEFGADSLLTPSVPEERIKRAQMWLDSEVIKDCNPYVPFRTGALAGSAIRHTIIGSGQITYETPQIPLCLGKLRPWMPAQGKALRFLGRAAVFPLAHKTAHFVFRQYRLQFWAHFGGVVRICFVAMVDE